MPVDKLRMGTGSGTEEVTIYFNSTMRSVGFKAVSTDRYTSVFRTRAPEARASGVHVDVLVVRALRSELPVVAFISGRIRSVVDFVGLIKLRKRCPKSCCAELHVQYLQKFKLPNYGSYTGIFSLGAIARWIRLSATYAPALLDLPVATTNAIYSGHLHTVSLRRKDCRCPMRCHATLTTNA